MRKLKERLGHVGVKNTLLRGARNYKFDGNLHFQGSETVTGNGGRTEFDAMNEFGFGTTNYFGTSGDAPTRSINFNAKDTARAKEIKKQLDDAGFKQE